MAGCSIDARIPLTERQIRIWLLTENPHPSEENRGGDQSVRVEQDRANVKRGRL
jgi:hypothetical protein